MKKLVVLFAAIAAVCITEACAGGPPKTSLELKVRVDPGACQEDRSGPGQTELVELLCKAGGEAGVKVEFPRREWISMRERLRDGGVPAEHPGK